MNFKPFYPKQSHPAKEKYSRLLLGVAQVGKLSSTNIKPFIQYRIAENVFCKAFSAVNIGRKDCSVDAYKEKDGIGIKTFLSNGLYKYEKIAEFNDRAKYPLVYSNKKKLIRQIASYRNKRLRDTKKEFQFKNSLYHYLLRGVRKILICECPMSLIEEKNILLQTGKKKHIIRFEDGKSHYYFHTTKNTLYKEFPTNNPFEIINIPSSIDNKLVVELFEELAVQKKKEVSLLKTKDYVILPLYSTRTGEVPKKSGLNQWNAKGRVRNYNEVYIPIPKAVHKQKPKFFPRRYQKFKLITQDGKEFSAKVCQDESKALMTDPNKDLGQWLLRSILKLRKGQLADSEFLRKKGADTVIIYKLSDEKYQIALHSLGGLKK